MTPDLAVGDRARVERLAHDLVCPLTVIRGFCFELERHESDPARLRHLRAIDSEVDRLAAGLAELQRPEERRPDGVIEAGEIIASTVRRLAPVARGAGRVLAGAVEARATVDGDRSRLQRALDNLVINALRYARHRVVVSSEVADRGAAVALLVRDDGPGVPAAQRGRIFDVGVRGRDARGSGRGLGLAIARDIALDHGGDLVVRPGGGGACFALQIPTARHAPESKGAA